MKLLLPPPEIGPDEGREIELVLLGQGQLKQAQSHANIEQQIGSLISYSPRKMEIYLKWAALPETQSNPIELDPHYGREIELLMAGQKNLSVFDEDSAPQSWQALDELDGCFDLTFTDYEIISRGHTNPILIASRASADRHTPRLLELLQIRLDQGFDAEREVEFWTLQGYARQEIDAYISWHATLLEKVLSA